MMATAYESSFYISDILECPMCKETLKGPKVLSCIHTFCLQCLNLYCAENNTVENRLACPVCKKIFSIPQGGIRHISDNVFIQRMLEAKTSAESLDKPPACELCLSFENETPSTSYCINCEQRMCDRCRVSHRNAKVSRSHRVTRHISIRSLTKTAKAGLTYCNQHASEVERLYCYDCKKVMCYMCVSAHSQHGLTDVERSANKLLKWLRESVKAVQARASQIRKDFDLLEISKIKFIEEMATVESAILKQRVSIIICDSLHYCNLRVEMNQFKERILNGYRYSQDEVKKQYGITQGFRGYCIEIMDKGTACEISRVAHELLTRAEELCAIRYELVLEIMEMKYAVPFTKNSKENFLEVLVFKDLSVTTPKMHLQPNLDFRSLLPKPKATRIIEMEEITALTILSGNVYIVREDSQIDVYESNNLSEKVRELSIPGSGYLNAIISRANHNYLYAVDLYQELVFRYDLASDIVIKWNVDGILYLLSLTNDCNTLCMTLDENQHQYLEEYNTQGTFLRTIKLDSCISSVQHCVQIANGNYVIAHNGQDHQICIMDQRGVVLASDKPPPGTVKKTAINPVHMCMDTLNNVLVIDGNDNKVLLLSSTLSHLGYVDLSEHETFAPESLHLDELNHRLYIKDYSPEQLLVVDIEAKSTADVVEAEDN